MIPASPSPRIVSPPTARARQLRRRSADIGSRRLLAARDMRGNGEPIAVPPRPYVGISARSRSAVRHCIPGPCMDDGKVSHDPNLYVVSLEIGNFCRPCRLVQESLPIDERAVRVG